MIQGDFLKMQTKDWRDADVVFANSTCYGEELMTKLGRLACKLITLLYDVIVFPRLKNPYLLFFSFYCSGHEERRFFRHSYETLVESRFLGLGVRVVSNELG